MILEESFREDVLEHIREEPDSTFEGKAVDKQALLADSIKIDALWACYQKSIEEYEADPEFAYADAMLDVLGIAVAADRDPILDKIEAVRAMAPTYINGGPQFQDADTVLADILDSADHALTGQAEELFRIYESAVDRDTFLKVFAALTGTSFTDYLDQAAALGSAQKEKSDG